MGERESGAAEESARRVERAAFTGGNVCPKPFLPRDSVDGSLCGVGGDGTGPHVGEESSHGDVGSVAEAAAREMARELFALREEHERLRKRLAAYRICWALVGVGMKLRVYRAVENSVPEGLRVPDVAAVIHEDVMETWGGAEPETEREPGTGRAPGA